MYDPEITDQAAELERLLPHLARRLFSLDLDDPASELPVAQVRLCTFLLCGPAYMSAVSDELGISISAVSQLADRLERVGLISRRAETDDRRVRRLHLTEYGRSVMQQRSDARVRRAIQALARLPVAQRLEVLRALRELLIATSTNTSVK